MVRNAQLALGVALLVNSLACGGDGDLFVDTSDCSSGRAWIGGEHGSALMHPGGDCIGCHEREGEGPVFEIAGTVYDSISAFDDCVGVEGAVVEVEDINGEIFTMTTNEAGNFYMTAEEAAGIEYPTQAVVRLEDREAAMIGPMPYGNCADCHTELVGRFYVP